jgi:hypothetical protein
VRHYIYLVYTLTNILPIYSQERLAKAAKSISDASGKWQ